MRRRQMGVYPPALFCAYPPRSKCPPPASDPCRADTSGPAPPITSMIYVSCWPTSAGRLHPVLPRRHLLHGQHQRREPLQGPARALQPLPQRRELVSCCRCLAVPPLHLRSAIRGFGGNAVLLAAALHCETAEPHLVPLIVCPHPPACSCTSKYEYCSGGNTYSCRGGHTCEKFAPCVWPSYDPCIIDPTADGCWNDCDKYPGAPGCANDPCTRVRGVGVLVSGFGPLDEVDDRCPPLHAHAQLPFRQRCACPGWLDMRCL